MTSNAFSDLGLKNQLVKVTEELFFKEPTEIQTKIIPEVLKENSVIGESQTGSGKTHAFLLPLLNEIKEDKNEVQYVIAVPTRELAMQIHADIEVIIELANKKDVWTSRLLVGGLDRDRMKKQLKNTPDIIIGTPGRILDMVKDNAVSIYSAKSFVIDEADLMLDMGFLDEIDQLLVRCRSDIQTLVFSATIPEKLKYFFDKYLAQPTHIEVKSSITPLSIEHKLIDLRHRNPVELIEQISQTIQPFVAIIFANNKDKANQLFKELKNIGLNVGILHGGLSARERKRLVNDVRDLKFEYIVATDLASRGIDIPGVSHIINVELPNEVDFYIHRVGRTARAGNQGMAISFFNDDDQSLIELLEKRGVNFTYSDITSNGFIERKPTNKRKKRKNTTTDLDRLAWQQVKRPKKVKPGYKKKMKNQQEAIKRSLVQQKNKRRKK